MSKQTNGAEAQPEKPETGDGQEKREENPEAVPGNEVPGNPAPGPENAPPVTPEEKIAELEKKLAESNDQLLRKAADFENYRKRVNKEKQEMADFSNQSLLSSLLPVIDDFGRAIKSAETSKDFASFYEGVIMIEKRLINQLENKWGLKGFDSVGEPFDPNRHEAVQMEKAAGIDEPVVKEEYEKGYLLKERVIRFAKVKVLMPAENPPSANEGASP
ncbi:MAG: nucleotide exchange factor GrpE [Treponema sp.]|jgi:molecular chaperone GrpE|nr:nucleotide exchange factor GrpE [Treponema sp.]